MCSLSLFVHDFAHKFPFGIALFTVELCNLRSRRLCRSGWTAEENDLEIADPNGNVERPVAVQVGRQR
ncbi:hypothetical protein BIW11_04865 [Tropilaelaps mercedesae]|uniref:Uncharacterized protein n=1 Tax=Tropilaelaps mercedesae TaxID=418985 RepID=A0A1V9X0S3_9ACAR|nr:hypothetical protein BIW11_04865 [Tropilaelaps mercedesae]